MRKKLTALTTIALILLAGSCSKAQKNQAKTWFVVQVENANAQGATEQTVAVVRNRLNVLGILGDVLPQESGRIRVGLPKVEDRERVKRLLTSPARFELRAVISPPSPGNVQTYRTADEAKAAAGANGEVFSFADTQGPEASASSFIVLEKNPIVETRDLVNAEAMPTANGESYSIGVTLGRQGAQRLGAWSGSHLNNYVAVILNGKIRSVVFVRSQFSEAVEIAGNFSKPEAEDLSLLLKAGDLPATVKIVQEGVITLQ